MPDRPDWMTPMDERILRTLSKTRRVKVDGMWLPPKAVALALPGERSYVNKRLRVLSERGFVECHPESEAYYRITELGNQYIQSGVP